MKSLYSQNKSIDEGIMVTRCDVPPESMPGNGSGLTCPDLNTDAGTNAVGDVDGDVRRTIRETEGEAALAWALRAALTAHDPLECRRLAERAGAQRDADAAPLLRTLCQPPRGLRMRLKRRQWARARVAALCALAPTDGRNAAYLAQALLDASPDVQDAAALALAQAGPDAAAAVVARLHHAGDWRLAGMKRLVMTLGRLHTPTANAALVPLILGSQPPAPKRWDRLVDYSLKAAITLSVCVALGMMVSSGSLMLGLLTLFGMMVGMTILWMAFVCFCALPFRAVQESYERNALAALAAEGLCRQDYITYLPAIIEGAFGYNRVAAAPARRALLHLLPLVTPDDIARFSDTTRQHLMEALGRSYNNEMDLALLRVLEWIGDGQVIPRVERIANRGATEELRAEAIRILPALHERHHRAQAPAVLLRPSQATPDGGDQLLRPGYATDTTPAVQLLRGSQDE